MLSIAFGQSKYYVDNLSENTKRGLRQKVRRGEYPGPAPIGYINDVRTKTVVVDKRRSPFVIEAFELYAKGNKKLQDIADFLASKGIKTSGGLPLKKDQIKYMLTNPFYYGHFRYAGEVHEGKHTPIVSKKLFDAVQTVIAKRGHKYKGERTPQALCGLLSCGTCNMAITAEKKIKHQKNGNVHEYVYYRCTRKNKNIRCTEPPVTKPQLTAQLSGILDGYAMPQAWAPTLAKMLDEDEKQAEQSSAVFIADAQTRIGNLQCKLQRLLDGYLDQDIDQPTYRSKQAELMSEKKSLEEQIGKLALAANSWIGPMRKWVKTAVSQSETAKTSERLALKRSFSEMDGLNLFLSNKKARLLPRPVAHSPQENIWLALRATKEKTAHVRRNSDFLPYLVDILTRYSNRTDLLVDLDHAARQIARGLAKPQPRRSISSTDRVNRKWAMRERFNDEGLLSIVQDRLMGLSQIKTAQKYGISESSVKRIMRIHKAGCVTVRHGLTG